MGKEKIIGNIKLIYEENKSNLTSICIGLEAGANSEDSILGVAHATEHMLYKGTKNRSESMINKELSDIFAFQNAMTNYPYVIYYGTLLNEDFEKGIDLFSDILLNPKLDEEGFNEEKKVIIEELAQWDEELEQFCEDKLFYNVFDKSRLKYPIIGVKKDLEKLDINDIRNFYIDKYLNSDMTITIVTSLEFDYVCNVIHSYFHKEIENINLPISIIREKNKEGTYIHYRKELKTSKIQVIYNMSELNEYEIKEAKILSLILADGVNSILFNELRTKRGLIYDIIPTVADEKGIELFKLVLSTSNENVEKVIAIIESSIKEFKNYVENIKDEDLKNIVKSYKLKELFKSEKGIVLAKEITTYNVMFKDSKRYQNLTNDLEEINKDELVKVIEKLFIKPSIQIIRGDENA